MSWDQIPVSSDTFVVWDPYISQPMSCKWDGQHTTWDNKQTIWDGGATVWGDRATTWVG